MNNIQVLHKTKIKTLFFVVVFTILSVITPMLTHYFGGPAAGRTFLPMHFFVLVAGLLLGWRAGLAVGILTPLISFSLTGMPLATALPFIVIETAAYGFFAGLLRESVKNIWMALIGAIVLGRAFLWLGIVIFPTKLAATQYLIGVIQAGWRGILLQLILVPFVVLTIQRFLKDESI
jgi:hypothetical protein